MGALQEGRMLPAAGLGIHLLPPGRDWRMDRLRQLEARIRAGGNDAHERRRADLLGRLPEPPDPARGPGLPGRADGEASGEALQDRVGEDGVRPRIDRLARPKIGWTTRGDALRHPRNL